MIRNYFREFADKEYGDKCTCDISSISIKDQSTQEAKDFNKIIQEIAKQEKFNDCYMHKKGIWDPQFKEKL